MPPQSSIDLTDDPAPTDLYRHWDKNGGLLYVGISLSAITRLASHRKSPWYDRISSITIEKHPTREAALAAEAKAIWVEKPIFNRNLNRLGRAHYEAQLSRDWGEWKRIAQTASRRASKLEEQHENLQAEHLRLSKMIAVENAKSAMARFYRRRHRLSLAAAIDVAAALLDDLRSQILRERSLLKEALGKIEEIECEIDQMGDAA